MSLHLVQDSDDSRFADMSRSDLFMALGCARAEIERLKCANAVMREQCVGYQEDVARLCEAVIVLDGREVTLWDAYEQGKYRKLCRCRAPECDGCSVSDAELLAEYQMEAHDRDDLG